MAHARAQPGQVDEWRLRARMNALAPRLTTAFTGTLDAENRDVLEAGKAPVSTLGDDRSGRVVIQASWELDRLVFEPAELSILREGVRMAELRDRVLEEVTRRYFERRRLQWELALLPAGDPGGRIQRELRVAELTAGLDAATGGWFGEQLAGPAPTSYEDGISSGGRPFADGFGTEGRVAEVP